MAPPAPTTDTRQAVEVRPRMTIGAREAVPGTLADAAIVFDVQRFSAYYGSFRAIKEITFQIREQPDHGDHRSIRLRQDARCCAPSTA